MTCLAIRTDLDWIAALAVLGDGLEDLDLLGQIHKHPQEARTLRSKGKPCECDERRKICIFL